ncbi:MAG: metal ABC transporter permease [Phycisphaerae bacterium]
MLAALDSLHALLRSLLPFDWAQPDFMLNALLLIALLAPTCAALGVQVVNFRMAFFSDAISHSAFTGVVLGYLLVPIANRLWPGFGRWDLLLPPLTLTLFGLCVGAGITAVRRRGDLSADTVIGVFFAAVIALGIAVISRLNLRADFERYLYGTVVATAPADVLVAVALAVVVALFLAATFNALLLTGLNESLARSHGLPTRTLDYLFALLLALVVCTAIRTIGLLLVTAWLVVPAAAARNIARSAAGMFGWAVLLGLATGIAGLILAYQADIAVGACIVLLAAAAFVLTFLWRILRARPARR